MKIVLKALLLIVILSTFGCKTKKKAVERERVTVEVETTVERLSDKKTDSTAVIATIREGESIEVESDSTAIVTREVIGNKVIITGAKKVTFKKEREEKNEEVAVVKEEIVKEKEKVETSTKTNKRTSKSKVKGAFGYWWLLIILLVLAAVYYLRKKMYI